MSLTLLVTQGPASRASLRSAELARALLANGETVSRVFFQGDGVLLCRPGLEAADDPHGAARLWQSLISNHRLPSTACSGSVTRRGLDDAGSPLADGIETAGLGQLASALQETQRLVSF